ncbi:unnamed protein product [Didymodactylos carnosus]|uniref:Uncharacterized protein n=1 Tax=Didymodactylos carnosus TaxID=1234261 RepID=A0A813RVT2_9BILA|nr:unnamed protein product [Didymodactylos carnosus]CAF3574431.1 unnamed protein product [Didymodactylos carnosus]
MLEHSASRTITTNGNETPYQIALKYRKYLCLKLLEQSTNTKETYIDKLKTSSTLKDYLNHLTCMDTLGLIKYII